MYFINIIIIIIHPTKKAVQLKEKIANYAVDNTQINSKQKFESLAQKGSCPSTL